MVLTTLLAADLWATAGTAMAIGTALAGAAGYLAVLRERTRGVPQIQSEIRDDLHGLREDVKHMGISMREGIDQVRDTLSGHGERLARVEERTRSRELNVKVASLDS